jgi:small subunit ribosomal protein S3
MGQKINPIGFRLSVNRNWASKWFANTKNFPVMLLEDIKVREYLAKKLSHAAVGRVVIERPSKNARITIYSARPGVVIGKKGEDIEGLRTALQKLMGVPLNGAEIARTEWYREGRVPLHTLRADIEYGFSEARTTYGTIGVQVLVFKGETLGKGEQPVAPPAPEPEKKPRGKPGVRNAAAS